MSLSDRGSIKKTLKDAAFKYLSGPLKVMPRFVEAIGAGVIISSVLGSRPDIKEKLKALSGKVFLFEATDLDKTFNLCFDDSGEVKVVPNVSEEVDVVMRAEVRVLVDLFLGEEDPDTVFFSRRFEINGDTSSAILLKNILATI